MAYLMINADRIKRTVESALITVQVGYAVGVALRVSSTYAMAGVDVVLSYL